MKKWIKIILLVALVVGLIPFDIRHSTRYVSDVVHATISGTGYLEIEPVYSPIEEYDLFMLEYRRYDTWDITAFLWELYLGTGEGKPWGRLSFPSCCNQDWNISYFIKFPLVEFRYGSTPRKQFGESKFSMGISFFQKDIQYVDVPGINDVPYISWNRSIGWSATDGWWNHDRRIE